MFFVFHPLLDLQQEKAFDLPINRIEMCFCALQNVEPKLVWTFCCFFTTFSLSNWIKNPNLTIMCWFCPEILHISLSFFKVSIKSNMWWIWWLSRSKGTASFRRIKTLNHQQDFYGLNTWIVLTCFKNIFRRNM